MGELDMVLATNPDLVPLFKVLAIAEKSSLVFFLLSAWGLFMINRKLGEKYAWLSFIPLIQLYSYATAANKSFKYYILFPILAIFLGALLLIPTFGISILIAIIYLIVMIVKLYHSISVRCGGGAWTTIGFLLIPFIMFPVVGYLLADKSSQSTFGNNDEIIVEEKTVVGNNIGVVKDKMTEIIDERIEL